LYRVIATKWQSKCAGWSKRNQCTEVSKKALSHPLLARFWDSLALLSEQAVVAELSRTLKLEVTYLVTTCQRETLCSRVRALQALL